MTLVPNLLRDVPQTGNLCQGFRGPRLIPLFVIIGAGGVGAGLYLMRLAMFNPDVSWDKKNNPEPWNKMSPSDQYKLYSVNMDYSRLKKDRPDF
uniref:Cytochrome c oxidase subunit NDUFA4 n=1 Tax=Zosterops lateralis melanops TaxID=1220523 RepID=A0A8D2PJK8_ZOSLA